MRRQIGIFGGSFDPVHLGHLWIAEAARESLALDQVRWIPAATSPLKPDGPVSADQDRLEMVGLAISGHPDFVVDDREICRGKVSYTVDTIAEIRREEPDADYFLIVGSDSLASLDRWHEPSRLLDQVTLAVIARGGDARIDFSILKPLTTPERIDRCQQSVVPMPLIELSSTELRERIAAGKSIRYRVPAPVAALIENRNLYHPQPS